MCLKIAEDRFDEEHGFGVAVNLVSVLEPVLQGKVGRVVISRIGLRRRKLVAYAFDGVLIGHKRCNIAIIVEPIFDMVLVSALMMEPRHADSVVLTANADGRAVAGEIPYALEKFNGRKFRKVMHETAPRNTTLTAVYENHKAVPCYKPKMLEKISDAHKFLLSKSGL